MTVMSLGLALYRSYIIDIVAMVDLVDSVRKPSYLRHI